VRPFPFLFPIRSRRFYFENRAYSKTGYWNFWLLSGTTLRLIKRAIGMTARNVSIHHPKGGRILGPGFPPVIQAGCSNVGMP
jgi:hypothetical protein